MHIKTKIISFELIYHKVKDFTLLQTLVEGKRHCGKENGQAVFQQVQKVKFIFATQASQMLLEKDGAIVEGNKRSLTKENENMKSVSILEMNSNGLLKSLLNKTILNIGGVLQEHVYQYDVIEPASDLEFQVWPECQSLL